MWVLASCIAPDNGVPDVRVRVMDLGKDLSGVGERPGFGNGKEVDELACETVVEEEVGSQEEGVSLLGFGNGRAMILDNLR